MLNKIKKILSREINEKEIDYKELKEILKNKNIILLDVRSLKEYNEDHLPNAINIDLYSLKQKALDMLPDKTATIIVYCSYGMRSKKAKTILEHLGYVKVYNLREGLYCYRKEL